MDGPKLDSLSAFVHTLCVTLVKKKSQKNSVVGPGLRWGDSVEVIAPGMAFDTKDFHRGLDVLESWGLKVAMKKPLLGPDPVCASSLKQREEQLRQALRSSSKLVWCARGGYGSLQLLSFLKNQKKPKNKKYLVGFSDISTLHQVWSQEWGWPSLHGPHVDRLGDLTPQRLRALKTFLFAQGAVSYVLRGLKPANGFAEKVKSLESQLIGGNLTTLQSTLGTPWQIKSRKRLLFFEDIGERAYRVDRILTHMELCGVFKGVHGVVFGSFTHGNEPGGRRSQVPAVVRAFAKRSPFPVFLGLRVGHIPQSPFLPLSTPVTLRKKASSYHLEFE